MSHLEKDRASSAAFFGIGLERVDDVHPVQRVQVIEVHHVILHVLRGHHDVADQLGGGRDGDAERVFNGAHAGQSVHGGADAADALGDGPGIARIAADEDLFQAAHHGAGAECVGDDAVFHHCFNAQVAFNASYRIDDNACHRRLRLLLIFSVDFRNHAPLANVGDHGMGRNSGQRGHSHHRADRVRRALDAEAGERGQVLVERAVVPEAFFAAADAAVAGLDGIAGALVPLDHRAGVVGDRTAAAHLVKAIALARVFVVQRLDEQAGIVVGAAIAGVVNAAAVELLGPALAVERGKLSQHQQVGHDGHHHVGDGRAAGDVDDRLVDELVNRRGAGWIGLGGLHAAVGGATAPGHDRGRILGDGLQNRFGGLAADHAVDAVILGGHRAFNQHDVLALVVRDGVVQAFFGLEAGGRHQASRCSSGDSTSSSASTTMGCDARMNDSLQQVHS